MFRYLTRALARQSGIIPVNRFELRRQWLVVRVADEVQADVEPVLHAIEDIAERCNRLGGNPGNARFEAYRRNEIAELDGLQSIGERLAGLYRVTKFCIDALRVLNPLCELGIQ